MEACSFCARISSLLILTTIFAISAFAQSSDLKNDLQTSFKKFDVVRVTPGDELRSTEGGGRTVSVQASGKSYELVVTPHDLRARNYRAEDSNGFGMTSVPAPAVKTFKGSIAGEATSEVRLTIDGSRIEGFFQGKDGRLMIEPASRYSPLAEAGDSVVYRAEDSLKDNTFSCESDIAGKIEFGEQLIESSRTESMMVVRVLDLATEADLEWVNQYGGAAQANAEILGILNMAEGTFNSEINLSIRVVYQHTWSSADPYSAGDMPGILTAFVNYWNANFGNVARDAAHLFSKKAAAQSRGLAYMSVICRTPAYSYGVSGYIGWAPGKFLVPAHELGHNLGADHADAAQNCANSLMNPAMTNSTPLSFCAFSRDTITNFISANGGCLTETTSTPTAGVAPFDFDGDGRTDLSVFRPANGVWYLNRSGAGVSAFQFGLSTDVPVAGDYDGDGKSDAAVFRAGLWYRLKSATGSTDVVTFGLLGDIPVPADFDGDGKTDVAVFRPSTGVWYWLGSSGSGFSAVRFGLAGDVPLPGDYDGDNRDDVNLYRPSEGTWYRLNSSTGGFTAVNFGLWEDKPVSGDFDGDSRADVAVWRPSNGVWYVLRSSTGSMSAVTFGLWGDIPATGDYDGDGKTDTAVFRPSNGTWYRLNSSTGAFTAGAFGTNGDRPVPSYYVP